MTDREMLKKVAERFRFCHLESEAENIERYLAVVDEDPEPKGLKDVQETLKRHFSTTEMKVDAMLGCDDEELFQLAVEYLRKADFECAVKYLCLALLSRFRSIEAEDDDWWQAFNLMSAVLREEPKK